jgi:hypothetical protein
MTSHLFVYLLLTLLPLFSHAIQYDGQPHVELLFPFPRKFDAYSTAPPAAIASHTIAPCGDYNVINETARTSFPMTGAPIAIDTYGNFSSPSPDSFSAEMKIGLFNATTVTQRDDVWYNLPLGHEWQYTGSQPEQLWCSNNVSALDGFILGAANGYLQQPVSERDMNGMTATFQWTLRSQFANGTVMTQYTVFLFPVI